MENEPTSNQVQDSFDELKASGVEVQKGQRTANNDSLDQVNKNIIARWLTQWYKQAVLNYPLMSKLSGVHMLTMAAKGLPAIVVGIGPSLDEELEQLVKLKASSRAIIISTDAALKPLLAHKITPHLVISFDCREEQASLFEGLETSELTLLISSCTHPKTLQAWQGSILGFNMDDPMVELCNVFLPTVYPNLGCIPSVGTVGNEAILLAWIMGCTTIMLLGMDLCYKQGPTGMRYRCTDYKTVHQNGIDHFEATENKLLYDNDLRVKDVFEVEVKGRVYTVDPELDLYRKIILRMIGKYDLPVINCSQGGILQEFVVSSSLAEAMREHAKKVINPGETTLLHMNKILGGRDENPAHHHNRPCRGGDQPCRGCK